MNAVVKQEAGQSLALNEQLRKLRAPFPPELISKLPKPTISNEEWKKLPKAMCSVCGGYHAKTSTMHLDYVGHAALTDRLLDVDPLWNWEPVAIDQNGAPVLDKDGGMWIKLTVCGVTRLGYGDSAGKTGPSATKERIGDALRNAAMRFGAALDLWSKADLHYDEHDGANTYNYSMRDERKPAELPQYPVDRMDEALDAWAAAIAEGRRTADQIIATISTKYVMSEEQKAIVRGLGAKKEEAKVADAEWLESYKDAE